MSRNWKLRIFKQIIKKYIWKYPMNFFVTNKIFKILKFYNWANFRDSQKLLHDFERYEINKYLVLRNNFA